MTRVDDVTTAFRLASEQHSVDIVGDPGSGRTYVLRELESRFQGMKWKVVSVNGSPAFRDAPLDALRMAGHVGDEAHEVRAALDDYLARAESAVILVDGVEHLDPASWGVLDAIAAKRNIPLVTTRRTGFARPEGTNFSDVHQVKLHPAKAPELDFIMRHITGRDIDEYTMSALYEKSAGNIGMAVNLLQTARKRGLVREDGALTAIADLWNPGAAAAVENLLHGLTEDERRSLEVIAAVDPAPLETVRRTVSSEHLATLTERGLVTGDMASGMYMVQVAHPVLINWFRQESSPMRRIELGEHFERTLPGTYSDAVPPHFATTTFGELVARRELRRVHIAQDAYASRPSHGTAAELLRAVARAGAPKELIDELTAESAALHGTEVGIRSWEKWGWHRAMVEPRRIGEGGFDAYLADRADESPSLAPYLHSWRAMYRVGAAEPNEADMPDPFALTDERGAREVFEARAYVKLAYGDVDGALEDLAEVSGGIVEPFTGVTRVMALMADGDYTQAAMVARRGMSEQRTKLNSIGMFQYAFAESVVAVLSGRLGDAEEALCPLTQLCAPTHGTPIHTGIATVAAAIATKHGGAPMAGLPAPLNPPRVDGPWPAQQPEWVTIERLKGEGRLAEAAESLTALGDRLWASHLRLAAAYAYLVAAEIDRSPRRRRDLVERVSLVGGKGIAARRVLLVALIDGDMDAVKDGIEWELRHTGPRKTAFLLTAVENSCAQRGDDAGADWARHRKSGIEQAQSGRVPDVLAGLKPTHLVQVQMWLVGRSNEEIAKAQYIAPRTVERHWSEIYKELGVGSRKELHDLLERAKCDPVTVTPEYRHHKSDHVPQW